MQVITVEVDYFQMKTFNFGPTGGWSKIFQTVGFGQTPIIWQDFCQKLHGDEGPANATPKFANFSKTPECCVHM